MALTSGTRLGPYEILAPLGAGGMGEVYRARDTRLGRDVAIKVLPEIFARDADRMARFEREAQVLASLNHPNIATLHGLEESGGVRALVMELVEGETLQGPIPLEEALPIAKQIAEALEYAHDRGIVHRDLKPTNVKITPEGKVKVLDFGLAKALDDDRAAASISNSPTISLAATRAGVILGTAAYMPPEQVRGAAVDRRVDIWAFGVVLYEMLTGKQAFTGDSVSDVLASVLKFDPDWSAMPADTPSAIRRLVRQCLAKDRKQRLQAIGDGRIVIEETLTGAPAEEVTRPLAPSPSRPVAWIAAGVLAVALVAVSVVHFRQTSPAVHTTRFQVLPPEKATFTEYPTISPDGRRLAFVASVEGKTLLWVRPLDSLAAQSMAGTEEASFPFWSPDSRFLGFFSQGKLKKVDVSGGPPQTLCNAESPAGGTWNRDGTILLGGAGATIRRVPAAGGVPALVTTLDSTTEVDHRWPQFLPDGRHFLYWLWATGREKNAVIIGSLDDKPDSKNHKRLLVAGSMAAYSAGHLLFEREGTLMAQSFDAARLELRGEPFPVVQQLGQTVGSFGWTAFSVSSEGTLAYRTGGGAKTQLAWFDRAGKEVGRLGQPALQLAPRLSPDQKRVAVARRDAQGQFDIWLLELARDTSTRFTSTATNSLPLWSPDGSRIVFTSNRDGPFDLYQKASTGVASEELLLKSGEAKLPTDWSSDGRFILYHARHRKNGWDLWVLPLEGDRKPIPVLQTEFNEVNGQFSPDGRWIAYQSDESTRFEVYVQGFPKPGGKFQVSTNGGGRPRWRRDGKEIYYLSPDRKMMAVEVKATATTFETTRPRELFQTRVASALFFAPTYDVTADGQRFLINTALEAEAVPPIAVVMNWAPKN